MKFGLLLLLIIPAWSAVHGDYSKLPFSFEPNVGQADESVKYVVRVPGYTLFLTSDGAVLKARDGSVERMRLIGASPQVRFEPLDQQQGISNYFIGSNPAKHLTNIPNYGRVALRQVYPGIDLVFYGNPRELEYDWIVAPGADPGRIRIKWEGREHLNTDANGDLLISGVLRQRKARIIQGEKEIAGAYLVRGGEISFDIARYDATKTLVIDPVLLYSTYLGGNGPDFGYSIAVDSAGNVYLTGATDSTTFPTMSPMQATNGGNTDVFVTKLNASGSARVYSTYLGGSNLDYGNAIAVDTAGNAYVTGYTISTNFPTTNPLQANNAGGSADVFVTKLNAAGSARVYSTYLGGTGGDLGYGIAVDSTGQAYITGWTSSTDFPTTASPMQGTNGGGDNDVFVTKLDAAGTSKVYSTYLGGSGSDVAYSIAVDSDGNAYIGGSTLSTNFPTTNAMQASKAGGTDGFVTKLQASGGARLFSTYLGGTASDYINGIAVDSASNTFVTGATSSTDFPTTNPIQASNGGGLDAFVTKLGATGTARIYSTYVGGSGSDQGTSIALDSAGNSYLTGLTDSTNFPTTDPTQGSNGGMQDAFVTALNSAGSARLYSTYLGGSANDIGYRIKVGSGGAIYLTGSTLSTNFPSSNPLQPANAGFQDAFVVSLSGLSTPGLRFVPVTPCRVMDTRGPVGPFGGPSIAADSVRNVSIPSSGCGIPSDAVAYALNATVVPSGPFLGWLTLWPAGQAQPLVSTLNSYDGRIKANAAIVPAGTNGQISVYATDTTEFVLDINGYFIPPSGGNSLVFYPVAPCRISDTRLPAGSFGGPSMTAGQTRSFAVPSSACAIPPTAQAYSLNMTVVPSGPLGYMTTWPAGQPQPFVSTLNAPTGAVTANAAIVPAGANGAISVYVTNPTDVIIDINGYFAPPGSPGELLFYSVNPCRISDTRLPVGPLGGPSIGAGQSRDFPVSSGSCGVPLAARALSLNATVVPSGPLIYLSLWPTGQTQPVVSTLNSYDGTVVSNAALVPTGTNGSVTGYVSNHTDLILDTNGYFAP